MIDVTLRDEVQPADRDAIHAILQSSGAFREEEIAVGLELLDETLNPRPDTDYLWAVAEDSNHVVMGFACYGLVPMTEGTFDLYWIAVASEARGAGVASLLERYVAGVVQRLRGRWLIAETSSTPPYEAARRFYQRSGYSRLETIPDYYRPGDDRVLYGKRLDR